MNRLSLAQQTQVVSSLVEGNSINATVRMTGVAKGTILGLPSRTRRLSLYAAHAVGSPEAPPAFLPNIIEYAPVPNGISKPSGARKQPRTGMNMSNCTTALTTPPMIPERVVVGFSSNFMRSPYRAS